MCFRKTLKMFRNIPICIVYLPPYFGKALHASFCSLEVSSIQFNPTQTATNHSSFNHHKQRSATSDNIK